MWPKATWANDTADDRAGDNDISQTDASCAAAGKGERKWQEHLDG